jgi:hypothetical protein
MKKIIVFSLLLIFISTALADFAIDRHTLVGGGGTSSGGTYQLTGTIGQADAANFAGGNYEVFGGFWPGGPLCFVDLEDFAGFADYWLETGADLPADFDKDNDVDLNDLGILFHDWLCLCPYDWPLR